MLQEPAAGRCKNGDDRLELGCIEGASFLFGNVSCNHLPRQRWIVECDKGWGAREAEGKKIGQNSSCPCPQLVNALVGQRRIILAQK